MPRKNLMVLVVLALVACGKNPTGIETVRPICRWVTDTLHATNGTFTVVSYKGCK